MRRFFKILCPEGGGALPVGEAPPKRGTIFRSQLYERVGKSFISVSKKEQKGEQVHFMAVRKSRQRSVFFEIYSYLKDRAFTAVERGGKF